MNWFKRKKSMNELKLELKQKKVGELVDVMLSSSTEVHFAPISDEYFIIDKEKEIHICLSESSVRIANHQYLYEVTFSSKSMLKYMDKAKKRVEEKTKEIKKELFKNEVELIEKIKQLYVTN